MWCLANLFIVPHNAFTELIQSILKFTLHYPTKFDTATVSSCTTNIFYDINFHLKSNECAAPIT